MQRCFSMKDVVAITGIPSMSIDQWARLGYFRPHQDPRGTGGDRLFSKLQVVGLVVAAGLRETQRKWSPAYVGQIVAAFGSTSEDALLEQFQRGKTHFVMIADGKLVLDHERDDLPDVQAICHTVDQWNPPSPGTAGTP